MARPRLRVALVTETFPPEVNGVAMTLDLPIPGYPELRFGLPFSANLHRAWLADRPDIVHIVTWPGSISTSATNPCCVSPSPGTARIATASQKLP